ncbi:S1C family serine protease [Dictyobacter arantiisoli]|uniref:Trypsin-like serine protease n=1 Tax=Dictyobacter arantiisoli TaxID=2014874 RepID=A0A5A5T9A6_9CHLR|nr:trypsin-like peptidase domain-containing protein [Dictyobacter arantiisoli]GCF07579.1 hypothetical protein KDI_11430 [Dictyobacter arantiisoli]
MDGPDDKLSLLETGSVKRSDSQSYAARITRQPKMRSILLRALLLALVFGSGMVAGWQFEMHDLSGSGLQTGSNAVPLLPEGHPDSREATREQVIKNIQPAVVQIDVKSATGSSVGSGVIIDRRGYIITNNHVIEGQQSIQVVMFNGLTLSARLIGSTPADDLAVIKINPNHAKLSVAIIGDSSRLLVGQDVLVIGNPLGITRTVTSGIVSALGRNVVTGENGHILSETIQIDAAINPGNSGGALIDMRGNLIGIPTLTAIVPEYKTPANGVGFAIPSNRIQVVAPRLISADRHQNKL